MKRGTSILALVAFALAGMIGGASAQSEMAAKGSPEHIRAATSKVDGAAIQANARTARDWLSYGLDYAETRFSRLRQINADNVKVLGLA
jgi:quinohemoprotein ethanol dehydrogenase